MGTAVFLKPPAGHPRAGQAAALSLPRIVTEFWAKPIPDRSFDWSAIDASTYDGAPDSSTRNHIGYGRTEGEAITDLLRLLDEIAEANDPREQANCAMQAGDYPQEEP